MGGWARGQFEQYHDEARLPAPPAGKLEAYALLVLNDPGTSFAEIAREAIVPDDFGEAVEAVVVETIIPGASVGEVAVTWASYEHARSQMATAANAIIEYSGRPRPSRPSRAPRYAPTPTAAPTPTPMRDRTAEIRARYGRTK